MQDQPRFELTQRPHPYPVDPGFEVELWGRLSITVTRTEGTEELFETEWNLAEFAEWFAENQQAICSEHLIAGDGQHLIQAGESLSRALARLQQQEFDDEELEFEWFTHLYNYRRRHVLSFAMRGSRMPQIVLGCNDNIGEISLFDEPADWFFRFDMQEFLADLRNRLRMLLIEWKDQAEGAAADRAQNILDKLDEEPSYCCTDPVNGHPPRL